MEQMLNPFQFKVTKTDGSALTLDDKTKKFLNLENKYFFSTFPLLEEAIGNIHKEGYINEDQNEMIITIHVIPEVSIQNNLLVKKTILY